MCKKHIKRLFCLLTAKRKRSESVRHDFAQNLHTFFRWFSASFIHEQLFTIKGVALPRRRREKRIRFGDKDKKAFFFLLLIAFPVNFLRSVFWWLFHVKVQFLCKVSWTSRGTFLNLMLIWCEKVKKTKVKTTV